ncbi:serine/threonine transporter SstT [Alicycliphilus denitrificans]|uniref:Serine/threonine transporter SstT n=1 Tax=Alicycliphilus denitrificans TaxID=179636 RepID=A0A858ZT37_9BURK|nr:serine/threonine transporter SstT [Alicycliphilus denitrificans]ADV00275.1 sodium:dicarboxylate symporter [Alicycliphilus denitrificans BC]QKD43943.1 serine/threonine transporter SstT [Alicycliphilus denitrificans]GAO23011.1 sodium:dicarboxylate symporter [Alicycliphilus sp. B1]
MILSPLLRRAQRTSLVSQIAIALILGVALSAAWPAATPAVAFLGHLFISALKAIAPVLVFVLVVAAIGNHRPGENTHMRPILLLYAIGTLAAAAVGVAASMWFPSTLALKGAAQAQAAPGAVSEVLLNVVGSIVANPVKALQDANYIGILAWAVALGVALRHASESTREMLQDGAQAVTRIIQWVIRCAPLGILGLVATTLAEAGAQALWGYAQLLAVLLGCMLFMALVVNPLIVFLTIRRNPYPLVLTCLRESGVTAFFTRSSAANIPINLALAKRLNLSEETYSIAIPLGATINMAGAAITISVLSLAAAHTLDIHVDVPTALLLCLVASVCACGASGVAGGSLLLIPLACSLFGIGNDMAMQVVGVGFIIGVLQDSAETALNSSTDVLFTAAACMAPRRA